MGGNALKEFTGRKNASEYSRISQNLLAALEMEHGMRVAELPYYRDKETFGDADVLVDWTGLNTKAVHYQRRNMPQWFMEVLKSFDAIHFYQNKPVYGFELDGLQIDLITCAPEDFESALNYFAWNDLGNLLGRIAHKMGFKYGHRGLEYVMRTTETHVIGTVIVTKNIDEILRFLGYDPAPFHKGFDTLEQVWQYAASSRYFNPAIYKLDQLNSKSKVRDKKRTTYMGFLRWLEAYDGPVCDDLRMERSGRHAYWLGKALGTFPEFARQYVIAHKAQEQRELARAKWNGDLVGVWTGARWKVLGRFMDHVRKTCDWTSTENLVKGIPEVIQKWTMIAWDEWSKTDEYQELVKEYDRSLQRVFPDQTA